MWELNYKESWVPKNWWFWTVVLEKTPESPLYCKEIQPVHPKGDQSWVFIGGTDVEAETPILWPPDVKNWLTWNDAGKGWRWEEKGTTEDEMVVWHHWHNGHGFGWTLGVGDGQEGLVCCGSWGHKESDRTELNWYLSEVIIDLFFWTGEIKSVYRSFMFPCPYPRKIIYKKYQNVDKNHLGVIKWVLIFTFIFFYYMFQKTTNDPRVVYPQEINMWRFGRCY